VPLLIASAMLLGLAVGSFLNVVIYRLPRQQSLVRPQSACPACDRPVRNRHNIPVFGWLVLRGRCADCGTRISARYPLVELGTGIIFVAMTLRLGELHLLAALPAFLLFSAAGIALAMIDIDVRRLPNSVVLPLYPVLLFALTMAAMLQDHPGALVRAVVGTATLFALYYLLAFSYPGGMGFGDVKLAGLIGMVLGFISYQALIIGAFAAFLLGGAYGIVSMALSRGSRKSAIPFGPFMILGVAVAVFAGDPIWHSYTSLVLT
jgi:leader peptidase (prepilin peptidase)/N-methyltransferase